MTALTRTTRRRSDDPQNVPAPLDEPDLVSVDTTWGELQPMVPVPGVRTVGELELAQLVSEGAVVVDTRVPDSRSGLSIPGAINVPHGDVTERRAELPVDGMSVLFCNGPQCPQTPDALASLRDAGHPLSSLAYYRGGMHDWVSLGMPTEAV